MICGSSSPGTAIIRSCAFAGKAAKSCAANKTICGRSIGRSVISSIGKARSSSSMWMAELESFEDEEIRQVALLRNDDAAFARAFPDARGHLHKVEDARAELNRLSRQLEETRHRTSLWRTLVAMLPHKGMFVFALLIALSRCCAHMPASTRAFIAKPCFRSMRFGSCSAVRSSSGHLGRCFSCRRSSRS